MPPRKRPAPASAAASGPEASAPAAAAPAGAHAAAPAAGQYRKLNHREHVLKCPSMYIGPIVQDEYVTWVWDEAAGRMAYRPVRYVRGLLKIVDEILVNAVDHAVRLKQQGAACPVRNIKVTIDRATGDVEVRYAKRRAARSVSRAMLRAMPAAFVMLPAPSCCLWLARDRRARAKRRARSIACPLDRV